MPHFTDAQDVYAHLGRLWQEIASDEQLGARLQRVDAIFQYRLREPEAQLTVKALAAEAVEVALGETSLAPEVVLSMDADTAHRFWLGELNPSVALARGDIKTRGPAAKVLKLLPLAGPAISRYRAQIEAGKSGAVAEAAEPVVPVEVVAEPQDVDEPYDAG